MLMIYPMLVSSNVSKNIVAGLCKVMERYLLIRILQQHALRLRKTAPNVSVGESLIENAIDYQIYLLESNYYDELKKKIENSNIPIVYGDEEIGYARVKEPEERPEEEPRGRAAGEGERETRQERPGREARPGAGEERPQPGRPEPGGGGGGGNGGEGRNGRGGPRPSRDLKINISRSFDTISLEPTYAEADDFEGKVIYGVKVVPFSIEVNSEEAAYKLFNKDWQRNFLSRIVSKLGRATIRLMYSLRNRFLRRLKISPSITGNPVRDIVYGANLKVADSVFIALTTADIDQEVLNKPKFIKRLMGLYWNSFIICDETQKTAHICMKAFNGLCSRLNYSYLMSGISKDFGKVYSDLEKLQSDSKPLFKLGRL